MHTVLKNMPSEIVTYVVFCIGIHITRPDDSHVYRKI